MVVRDTVWGDIGNKLKWRTTDYEDLLILISGNKLCLPICYKQG